MQESNWCSKRTNTNSHLAVFIKGLVQSRLENFSFHDHDEKFYAFDLNKYTQEDSYIL